MRKPKHCGECDNRIGEECGIDGHEVWNDSECIFEDEEDPEMVELK